ncbi:MAG: hypothetical protein EBS91_07060 [Betaproteobacteria bacterium]|nr:hypothetical protein [Betaproteobacteria bacterium]
MLAEDKSSAGGAVDPAAINRLVNSRVIRPLIPDLEMLMPFAPTLLVRRVSPCVPDTTTASPLSLMSTPSAGWIVLAKVPTELMRKMSMSVASVAPPKPPTVRVVALRAMNRDWTVELGSLDVIVPTLQFPVEKDKPTLRVSPRISPRLLRLALDEKLMVLPLAWVTREASKVFSGLCTSRLMVSMFRIVGLMSSKKLAFSTSASELEGSLMTSLTCKVPMGALRMLLSVVRRGVSVPAVRLSWAAAALMSASAVKVVLLVGSNDVPLILNSTFATAGLLLALN